jgi:hypothetical protein
MTRKFNAKNLNKLIKGTVIFIAFLAIAYFVFLYFKEDSIMEHYSSGIEGCPSGMESCYAIWHKYLDDYRKAQLYSGLFGFAMPLFFYIGKKIFNYIYPEIKP